MKKIISVFITITIIVASFTTPSFAFGTPGVDYTISSFVAPYATFETHIWIGDYTSDFYDINNYPNVQLLAEADYTYNCFTYTLIYDENIAHISQLENDQVFLLSDVDKFFTSANPCISYVSFQNVQPGDLVKYESVSTTGHTSSYQIEHVGIVDTVPNTNRTLENTMIRSKWGQGDIFLHAISNCPYLGTTEYDDATILSLDPSPITRQIEITFYQVNHNYSLYTPIIVAPPRPSLPATSSYHLVECSGCGAFHCEMHRYISIGSGRFACADCGYTSGITIQNVDENEVK